MTVSQIVQQMIEYCQGSNHDINHFMKVHSFARIIGQLEGLPEKQQRTLEIAAVVHDIACPLCREKYGAAYGKRQEQEGMPLTREFFAGTDLEEDILERVVFLVGHHHTLDCVDGIDYQILLEADYLVNANEGGSSREQISATLETLFRTETGKALLRSIYLR